MRDKHLEEVGTFVSEVKTLAESYIPIVPLVIPLFIQPLTIPSPIIFNLFIEMMRPRILG